MREFTITTITDMGNDVLTVEATDGTVIEIAPEERDRDGKVVKEAVVGPRLFRATGWVSATTNHFDPDVYDKETGHRRDGSKPRAMTPQETGDYARRLLAEQNPEQDSKAASKPIDFA